MRKKHILLKIFIIVLIVLALSLLIHYISSQTLDKTIEYKQITFSSGKITQELDRYRIAFITDTHSMSGDELRAVVEKVDTYSPNLLLLGGDFPAYDGAPRRSIEILSAVKATDGIYGVEGNHDNYKELFAVMEEFGVHPLSNSGVEIRDNLYLGGVEDLWNRKPDIAAALSSAKEDDFVVLLSHNPDLSMLQDTTKVDVILSGHTHGGQITLFGLWAPALTQAYGGVSNYGQRFMSGWAKSADGTSVYVSNGTGYLSNIPRVFARPQVILLTLKSTAD